MTMMADMEIVELDASFIQEASRLLASYQYPDGWKDEQREQCKAALQRLLESGYMSCIMVRRQGACAGFLSYSWGLSTTKGLPILRIQDVYTSPDHRRAGVAEAMLHHVIAVARERGAHRLQLETDTDNLPARSLYEKVGFEWISHKEVYMCPLKQWNRAD